MLSRAPRRASAGFSSGPYFHCMPRRPRRLRPLYQDLASIEHGKECALCLRWFIPVFADLPCPHCENRGTPRYPNRVRSFAIRAGISLREVARRSKLAWSGMVEISNGRRAPHLSTQCSIVKALGLDASDPRNFRRVFPNPRGPNRPRTVKEPEPAPQTCSEAPDTMVGPARSRVVTPPSPPLNGAHCLGVRPRTPGLGHLVKANPDALEFGRLGRRDPRGTRVTRRSVRRQ